MSPNIYLKNQETFIKNPEDLLGIIHLTIEKLEFLKLFI